MVGKAASAPPPTYRMSSTDRQAGFTLIEIVAVMAIIALVASLVTAATPGTGRAGLKAASLRIAALFRHERLRAVLNREVDRVSLDSERRMLVGDGGETVPIPADITVNVLGADAVWSGRLAIVQFEPDGQSTGVALRLSREQAGYEVRVNWYTGGVAVIASDDAQ
jgi:general secretion pathway protein H